MANPHVRVSRRQMLRMLGVGVGSAALSACAGAPTAAPAPAPTTEPSSATEPVSGATPQAPSATSQVAAPEVVDTIEAGQAAYGGYNTIHPKNSVELLVWGIPGDETDPFVKVMKSGMQRFQEAYPEIKVRWEPIPWNEMATKVNAAVAAGQGPDIVYEVDMEGQYPRNKVIRPIPEEVLPKEFIKKHGFYEVRPLPDGELYWVHSGAMGAVMYANRQLLEQEGVKISDVPKTWDEFVRLSQQFAKFENGQMVQAGLAFNGSNPSMMWDDMMYQQKASVYSPKKSHVNTPEGEKAWQLIVDMYDKHKINDRNFLDASEAFGTGKAAFRYGWTFASFGFETDYPDLDWVTVPQPTFTGEGPYGRMDYDGHGWMVTTLPQGERLDAAWELFKFHVHDYPFLVDKMHTSGCTITTKPHPDYSGAAADFPNLESPTQEQRRMQALATLQKQFDGGMVFPGELQTPFYEMLDGMAEGIVSNNRPIKDVLVEYEKRWDEVLNQTDFWITPEA